MSKSGKWRACPALGRDISSGDCGEQRQSRLACPADCAHNPFNPACYLRLLEIEAQLDAKATERMVVLTPDSDALGKRISRAGRDEEVGLHAFFVWHLFFEQGNDGRTFGQLWEHEGLKELKNDERVLWRGKMQTRVALLEVHRVLEGGRLEAVDLLSPEPAPMVFQDLNFASVACRFSTILGWIYPLPHFWRLSGTASTIPNMAQFTALEIVRDIVRHLGGPLEEKEMRRWLAEHFGQFHKSLLATSRLRRRQMFSAMDAKLGRVVYELRAPFAQCRGRLDEYEMVSPDHLSDTERDEGFAEAWVWFDESPMAGKLAAPGGKPVLGRLLLGQSFWRLEAFGAEKLTRLRGKFENLLGTAVRFQAERVDDLAAQLNAKGSFAEESLVPPRLLENPNQIVMTTSRRPVLLEGGSPEETLQKWMREMEMEFLDEKVPALTHRTPRDVARDPALRPRLVQLMKERIRSRDEENLRTGRNDDINWMLKELSLNELIFDPPPWRPPPPQSDVEDEVDDPEFAREAADPDRPPAPALPSEPLTFEEAAGRYQKSLKAFETFAAAEMELAASGSTLLEDADELTSELLSDDDFGLALPFLVQTWFALVPPGCLAPELNFTVMEKTFASNLRKMHTSLQTGSEKQFEASVMASPQPNLVLLLASALMQSMTDAPKGFRPSVESQPVIMALLKTVIEELDTVLRPQ